MARPRKQEEQADFDLAARLAELEAILKPFAEHGRRLRLGDRRGAPRKVIYENGQSLLTLGDFDAASRAIFGGDHGRG